MQHDNWPTNWKTNPPEAQGMDSTVLAQIDDYIANAFPTLLSLLIVRHGKLVFEHYFQQCHATASANGKSVTKSIVSALVGIAMREHYLTSLDQRLIEFFPQDFPAGGDPRKRDTTLKHLLTLRSGFQWVENSAESLPGLFASDNWVRHALSLQLLYVPGEVFAYSTLDAHLLSAVLAQVTLLRDVLTSLSDTTSHIEMRLFWYSGLDDLTNKPVRGKVEQDTVFLLRRLIRMEIRTAVAKGGSRATSARWSTTLLVIFGPTITAFLVVGLLIGAFHVSTSSPSFFDVYVFIIVAIHLLFVGIVALLLRREGSSLLRIISFERSKLLKHLGLALAALVLRFALGLAYLLCLSWIGVHAGVSAQLQGLPQLFALVVGAASAGFCEEVIWRGSALWLAVYTAKVPGSRHGCPLANGCRRFSLPLPALGWLS